MTGLSQAVRGRLVLVDGHAYAYRAFYAIRSLSSPAGEPTNAIFGFIKMLGKIRDILQPTHVLVVWDGGLDAERTALLPEYKAQRPPMPDGLEKQMDQIVDYLGAAGLSSYCQEGVEADDWIATVARQAAEAGLFVVVASSDKDFMQLVSPDVGLLNPSDKTEKVWTDEQVRAKTGVEPGQIVDWLSLIGDSVDNIPGVPGIGPKTATDLLRQFGSISGLMGKLDEVKSERLRDGLRDSAEELLRNQKMIALKSNLPSVFEPVELEVKPGDRARLRELYARWGFKTMLQELEKSTPLQPSLFGRN